MAPTTLVTFRVRAPTSTRSLDLYGSWDNFAKPYPMSKDLQVGSSYWSGCFNFSNIICDGNPSHNMKSRSGGLKMGGTYWYHYKVDDNMDFHNVCERATSNCPLMPGQLVNVLNVPYAFSSDRSRDASTSSTTSQQRTLNPQDRFMNPRPAPAKPEVLRVRTSPTETAFPSDLNATPTKETPNGSRFLRLPKKPSIDSYTTSPGGALAGGLRAAFKLRTARSQSPSDKSEAEAQNHRRAVSVERNMSSPGNVTDTAQPRPSKRGLLLRSASDDSISTLSFEQHRQQRSLKQEKLVPRSTKANGEPPRVEALNLLKSHLTPLGTVEEIVSKENTPVEELLTISTTAKVEVDLGKRLPTLPNTPSSAYPASMMGDSPPRIPATDIEQLNSHFSATTIDTEAQPLSTLLDERSRFSAWTTTTRASSVFIDSSAPPPLPELDTLPSLSGVFGQEADDHLLPSMMSLSSISSSISTTPSTSWIDTDAEFDAVQQPMAFGLPITAPSQIQHYSLPEDEYTSQTTLKTPSQEQPRGRSGHPMLRSAEQPEQTKPYDAQIVHSESMQRLLNELSYLSEMIQH